MIPNRIGAHPIVTPRAFEAESFRHFDITGEYFSEAEVGSKFRPFVCSDNPTPLGACSDFLVYSTSNATH